MSGPRARANKAAEGRKGSGDEQADNRERERERERERARERARETTRAGASTTAEAPQINLLSAPGFAKKCAKDSSSRKRSRLVIAGLVGETHVGSVGFQPNAVP